MGKPFDEVRASSMSRGTSSEGTPPSGLKNAESSNGRWSRACEAGFLSPSGPTRVPIPPSKSASLCPTAPSSRLSGPCSGSLGLQSW